MVNAGVRSAVAAWSLVVFACRVLWSHAAFTTTPGASIAGGLFHTCMIRQDYTLVCFGGGGSARMSELSATDDDDIGFGLFGQIGSGNNDTIGDEEDEMGDNLPTVDLGGASAQVVAAGQSNTCVVLDTGQVACWGFNYYGQLGLGNNASRGWSPSHMGEGLAFVDLGTGKTAVNIGCGQHHCCAVLDDGSLKCWGVNRDGMLGLGDTEDRGDSEGEMGDNLPTVDLGTGRTAVSVDGGRYHTCALLDNAGVKCWGGGNATLHNYGQLGQGNTYDIGTAPGQMGDALPEIDFGSGRTVVDLAAGWTHTCVILDDGTVRCFGRNFDGQLGQGDNEDRGDEAGELGDALPAVNLGTGRLAVSITCGRWHTCVVLDNAEVKCFGVSTSDDFGAGQLGLEDYENRGLTVASMGDNLENVDLGVGRTPYWVKACLDHTCVIFHDANVKCWGINVSGELGQGDTIDRGAEVDSMGDSLSAVQVALRLACPLETLSFFDDDVLVDDDGGGEGGVAAGGGGGGSLTVVVSSVVAVVAGLLLIGVSCTCYRRRAASRKQQEHEQNQWAAASAAVGDSQSGYSVSGETRAVSGSSFLNASGRSGMSADRGKRMGSTAGETRAVSGSSFLNASGRSGTSADRGMRMGSTAGGAEASIPPQVQFEKQSILASGAPRVPISPVIVESASGHPISRQGWQRELTTLTPGAKVGLATAAGTVAATVASTVVAGWDVLGAVAENLPWIGVAFHMLHEIVDMVDTKHSMQDNMVKIKRWAVSLEEVILQMDKRMKGRPLLTTSAMELMEEEVMSSLRDLVNTVAAFDRKGALAQYAASRSCQKAVDAADGALRGALARLTVGQGAELMAMVADLKDAGLVVDEKLDMIIVHLQKQEEQNARLEMRLAEYSESIAETLGQFMVSGGTNPMAPPQTSGAGGPGAKTLRQMGKEQLDRLQISKDDITFTSDRPFAAGSYSQVFRVVHEGAIKAAKVVNLTRLGLSEKDVSQVFGRFVKELYILSQMHSQRIVSVYGAIASAYELTLITEYAERGSIRTALADERERLEMTTTPGLQHRLVLDIAEGMAYLYNAGVEHRDLKSANCLVTHDWRAKIADFGLSKTTDALSTFSASTTAAFRGGTLSYAAPEVFSGSRRRGHGVPAELTDVFSYGVVMWDVLVSDGKLPWADLTVDAIPFTLLSGKRLEIPPSCRPFYRTLMLNCWREDPVLRPNFQGIVHALKTNPADSLAGPATTGALDTRTAVADSQTSSTTDMPPPPPYSEIVRYRAVSAAGSRVAMNNSAMPAVDERGGSTGRANDVEADDGDL